jgi:coatomer subunit gamma
LHKHAFNIDSVPLVSKHQEKSNAMKQRGSAMDIATGGQAVAIAAKKEGAPAAATSYSAQMEKIPELVVFGPPFKSSSPVMLTESETEYVVKCIKHVFADHLVFQFECTNTLNDVVLENVSMQVNLLSSDDEEIRHLLPQFSVPAARLTFNTPSSIYVAFKRQENATPSGKCD